LYLSVFEQPASRIFCSVLLNIRASINGLEIALTRRSPSPQPSPPLSGERAG
jgi:hypothetical protein